MMEKILNVKGLTTRFPFNGKTVHAVEDVYFTLGIGQTLGLVGESGCGKSTIGLSIMRLVSPPGKTVKGEVRFRGEDLLRKTEAEMEDIRGKEISMIFQDPMTSLNPTHRVIDQISEGILTHNPDSSKGDARHAAIEMMRKVGIPQPEERANVYPHELSGGLRQRVMIAIMLACKPSLLIADEPTTALDVTVQAQILNLMKMLRKDIGMSVIFISHNIGVIAGMADHIAVMYAGKIVEYGSIKATLSNPKHPYLQCLLRSLPKLGERQQKLLQIPGTVPDLLHIPSGCPFHPRCPSRFEKCDKELPKLIELERDNDHYHYARCFLNE
jgi:peptide/nickel transport system ATP-binding protein